MNLYLFLMQISMKSDALNEGTIRRKLLQIVFISS